MGKKYSVPQLEKNMLVNFSDLKNQFFSLIIFIGCLLIEKFRGINIKRA